MTAVYSKLEQHTDTTLRDCVDASERCRAEIASRCAPRQRLCARARAVQEGLMRATADERLAPYLVEIDAIEQQVNMLAQAAAALDEMSQQVAGQVQQLGRG